MSVQSKNNVQSSMNRALGNLGNQKRRITVRIKTRNKKDRFPQNCAISAVTNLPNKETYMQLEASTSIMWKREEVLQNSANRQNPSRQCHIR